MSGDPNHQDKGMVVRWAVAAATGAALGAGVAILKPSAHPDHPTIEAWMVAPFAALLASIAMMPIVAEKFWHRHFPEVALFLGMVVAAFYLVAFRAPAPGHSVSYGAGKMLHAAEEYYSFLALVGGLYVVSGGVLIEVRGRCTPLLNTALLAVGAVIANLVGTTGASMLLIRPFMRINKGRLTALHVVFFIFIVSNCGGCLTPIGDPPLYLGYLKGVAFEWTLLNLWQNWALVVGLLLAVFYIVDRRLGKFGAAEEGARPRVTIRGSTGLVCLVLMLVGVFIPPALKAWFKMDGLLIGATFQMLVAAAAYTLTPRELLRGNDFTFGPVKEVGMLFAGIFLTMVPALGYLGAHSASLGIDSALGYFFATGSLSAVLDNAPTYLSFLQVAFGPEEIDAAGVARFLSSPGGTRTLVAISTGAVFFGAATYIGNGPNFMVKAIAEGAGVRMPGFFGYIARAGLVLVPVLVLHALIFIR